VLAGAAVLTLAAASTVAIAAASDAFHSQPHRAAAPSRTCAAATLPGATVTVQLVDVRALMRRGSMMGGGGMMGQGDWRQFRPGMMRVTTSSTSVTHGTVSLIVTNTGYLTHELVVLPLPAGQPAGARRPGTDGTVPETGSLGEVSATCAGGAGDGIAAGSTGWVTLTLPVGRYELACNLPGHYASGMYAELNIT
jgi:uncharacterized cupredoxin-like copper-binding protein